MPKFSRLLCFIGGMAPFTTLLATQPELTTFARALFVRRFESRYWKRHAATCTAALAMTVRPKGPPFFGCREISWWRCGSRLHCHTHCRGHCALVSGRRRMILGCIRTYSARSARWCASRCVIRASCASRCCFGAVWMCAQKVPGATRAELWCRVESEGDRWCFRNLIERRCAWYQWFKLKRRHRKRSTGCPPLVE